MATIWNPTVEGWRSTFLHISNNGTLFNQTYGFLRFPRVLQTNSIRFMFPSQFRNGFVLRLQSTNTDIRRKLFVFRMAQYVPCAGHSFVLATVDRPSSFSLWRGTFRFDRFASFQGDFILLFEKGELDDSVIIQRASPPSCMAWHPKKKILTVCWEGKSSLCLSPLQWPRRVIICSIGFRRRNNGVQWQ